MVGKMYVKAEKVIEEAACLNFWITFKIMIIYITIYFFNLKLMCPTVRKE